MITPNFRGSARRLGDQDIAQVAHNLGCGEDAIHAVLDVEARGSGFDDHGRPAMLFEPHKFYAALKGAEQRAAVKAGVAYPRWGMKPYPEDSYPRLQTAMAINRAAALASASWGLSQILASNFHEAGCASVEDMVARCCESEGEQLKQMAALIKAWKLDEALRVRNWKAFARRWNGPGYRRNNYDVRLAARWRWWQTKPDTPWSPQVAALETQLNDPNSSHVTFGETA